MPDRRRSWKTDSQWIRLALTATGVGVSLILALAAAWKSSPVIYLGVTLALVGAYISCAVLVVPLPLPLLLSERRNRAFRRGVGALLVEGHELRARPVSDKAELVSLDDAYQDWSMCARAGWIRTPAPPMLPRSSTRSVPRRSPRLLRPRPQRLAAQAFLAAERAA